MPVSSPSYFPPAGSGGQVVGTTAGLGATGLRLFLAGAAAGQFTQGAGGINDLVVVGDHALSAGSSGAPITDVNLSGTVALGSNAAAALTQVPNIASGSFLPSTVVGFNALTAAGKANGCTVIGSNALQSYSTVSGGLLGAAVIIGESAAQNLAASNSASGMTETVIIGTKACLSNSVGPFAISFVNSVVIGDSACGTYLKAPTSGGPGIDRCVVIGSIGGQGLGSVNNTNGSNDNILIGYSTTVAANCRGSIIMGSGATDGGAVNCQENVAIGSTVSGGVGVRAGFQNNVVIGANAVNAVANTGCILLGSGAGKGTAIATANNQFLVETLVGGTRRNLLYGVLADGATNGSGIIVGFSTPAINQDLPGQNILKLLNGSATGVAPVGGGFFYSLAGRLHWVDTANVDWVLTGTAAGQLASSLTGFANNAGAQAATIANGPTAGNPTKWIPINDNGTIRNIPAW